MTASLLPHLAFLQQANVTLFSLKDGLFAPVSLTIMVLIHLRSHLTEGPGSDQGFPSFSPFAGTGRWKDSVGTQCCALFLAEDRKHRFEYGSQFSSLTSHFLPGTWVSFITFYPREASVGMPMLFDFASQGASVVCPRFLILHVLHSVFCCEACSS